MKQTKKITAKFYKTQSGNRPVRDWLLTLTKKEMGIIGRDICTVEFSWPIGPPLVKKIEKDLWEIRSDLPDGKISRVLFTIVGKEMVLLHGFIKKDQKMPKKEIETATKRKGNLK